MPSFKPVVAQLKNVSGAPNIRRPVAPPVYKPQAPNHLQLKTAPSLLMKTRPVAPPPYQPQPACAVAQPKMAPDRPPATQPLVNKARQSAPPVFSLRANLLQAKMASGQPRPSNRARQPVAPPVYRPEPSRIKHPAETRQSSVVNLKAKKSPRAPVRTPQLSSTAISIVQRKLEPMKSVMQPKRLTSSPFSGRRPGVVQLKLDEEIKLNTFMEDLGADGNNKAVKEALNKLLTAANSSKLDIKYEWLKAKVKAKAMSEKNVDKLRKDLDTIVGKLLDKQLSGDKGHMIARHVLVDKQSQEARLEGNLAKVTRVVVKGKEGEKYMNYVKSLDKSAPALVKTHVDNVSANVLADMNDTSSQYTIANNLGARRTALRTLLDELSLPDEAEDFTITYTWVVRIDGAVGAPHPRPERVQLTCTPTIVSNRGFLKLSTEKVKGQTVESQEYEPVTMYWGGNKIKIDDIEPTTTFGELEQKVAAINFKLGVTQF